MNGATLGKLLIYTTLICLGAYIFYNYYKNNIGGGGIGGTFMTPKEMQINYVPKDFSFDMDEETALAILTNPQRYRKGIQ